MVNFIPEPVKTSVFQVPYFEDSSEVKVPGWRTRKTAKQLQLEILDLMLKLNAGNVIFTPGSFPAAPDQPPRYGYLMTFSFNGIPGRMEIAALPLRKETQIRKNDALEQSLFLVRHWLESEVYSVMYRPGSVPLIPFLIGAGNRTVTEMMVESGNLPKLTGGE